MDDIITFLRLQKMHDDLGRRLPNHRVTAFTHELALLKSLHHELIMAKNLPPTIRSIELVAEIENQLNISRQYTTIGENNVEKTSLSESCIKPCEEGTIVPGLAQILSVYKQDDTYPDLPPNAARSPLAKVSR